MKTAFISWTRFDRRSDMVARHIGASMHFISYGRERSPAQAPLRYTLQSRRTWQILARERPDVVFAQNPPIFCAVLAAAYARRFGARYVLDSHSAAFMSPKWRWALGLHRDLSRGAVVTLVSNERLARQVRSWGARALSLGYTPGSYPHGVPYPLPAGFNAAVISSFAEDEPLDVVFAAARLLSGITFHVTGRAERCPAQLRAARPANCHLTGYLSEEEYVGLLRGADVVLDLTTRDETLLLGGYEAVAVGTPLITSDWPVLRDYFSRGTVHVPNTVEGLCAGLAHARRERDKLRDEMVRLREQLHAEWERGFAELQGILQEPAAAPHIAA